MKKILALLGCAVFCNQCAEALDIVYPAGKYNKTYHDNIYFMGSLSEDETLYYQGAKVETSKKGGFAFTVPLRNGRNQVFLRVCKSGSCSIKQYVITKEIQKSTSSVEQDVVTPLGKTVFKTNADGVPLRSTPVDAGMNRMGHLSKDTSLIIDGRKGDFFRVYLSPTKYGWISKKDVILAFDEKGYPQKPALASFYNIDDKTVPNLSMYRAAFTRNLPYEVIDTPEQLLINIYNVANVADETLVLKVSKTQNIKYSTEFANGDFTLILKNSVKPKGTPLAGLNIAIDAGHGGQELGAMGIFRDYEKDFNLAIAHELARMLEAQGANVYMTRVGDVDVALNDRVKLAKAYDADMFVSIHLNSVPQGSDPVMNKGSSVYYYNSSAKYLADSVKQALVKGLGTKDDGTKQASFAVLRASEYLGILAEICYMVNPEDSDLYKSEKFAKETAEAITKGLINYAEVYINDAKALLDVSDKYSVKSNKNKKKEKVKKDSPKSVTEVKAVRVKPQVPPKEYRESLFDRVKSKFANEQVQSEAPFLDTSVREKYQQEAIYTIDKSDTKWYRPNGKKRRVKRPPREIKSDYSTVSKEVNLFASGDYDSYNIPPSKPSLGKRCRDFCSKITSYFYNGARN